MHPNSDEITAAKRVLNDAGYVCVHWVAGASWAVGHSDEIAGPGLSISLTADEIRSAADQINRIWGDSPDSK